MKTWVKVPDKALKTLLAKDACAQAAVEFAAQAAREQMQEAGVDLPEYIELDSIKIKAAGESYVVIFAGGLDPVAVETRLRDGRCTAKAAI